MIRKGLRRNTTKTHLLFSLSTVEQTVFSRTGTRGVLLSSALARGHPSIVWWGPPSKPAQVGPVEPGDLILRGPPVAGPWGGHQGARASRGDQNRLTNQWYTPMYVKHPGSSGNPCDRIMVGLGGFQRGTLGALGCPRRPTQGSSVRI